MSCSDYTKRYGTTCLVIAFFVSSVFLFSISNNVHAAVNVREIIKKLASSDQSEFFKARSTLLALGKKAVPEMINALNDDKENNKAKLIVINVLGEMGLEAKDAIPTLKELKILGDGNIKYIAGTALSEIDGYMQNGLPDMPENAKLYCIGVEKGKKTSDIQLGKSGRETTQVDIVVSEERHPVVLVLSSYSPIIWRVGRTKNAKIAGILVSGRDAQALIGVQKDIPRRVISGEQSQWRHIFKVRRRMDLITNERAIKAHTGMEIEKFYDSAPGDIFFVGQPEINVEEDVIYSDDLKLDMYPVYKGEVPAGLKGVEVLLEKGKIRKATKEDIQAWLNGAEKDTRDAKDLTAEFSVVYVALEKIDIPPGLAGAHRRFFIIPKGVPKPGGKKGHCKFYFMEDFTSE
jgi:hypothetical protein